MGDSVKCLTKDKISNNYCYPLIYQASLLIAEGLQFALSTISPS